MSGKVYITNRGSHDYSAAGQWGELVFCTNGSMSKFDTGQMYRELCNAMADSVSTDYILLTSLTTLCSVACGLFAHKHGRLNLLIFKPNDGYLERTIMLANLTKEYNG